MYIGKNMCYKTVKVEGCMENIDNFECKSKGFVLVEVLALLGVIIVLSGAFLKLAEIKYLEGSLYDSRDKVSEVNIQVEELLIEGENYINNNVERLASFKALLQTTGKEGNHIVFNKSTFLYITFKKDDIYLEDCSLGPLRLKKLKAMVITENGIEKVAFQPEPWRNYN